MCSEQEFLALGGQQQMHWPLQAAPPQGLGCHATTCVSVTTTCVSGNSKLFYPYCFRIKSSRTMVRAQPPSIPMEALAWTRQDKLKD